MVDSVTPINSLITRVQTNNSNRASSNSAEVDSDLIGKHTSALKDLTEAIDGKKGLTTNIAKLSEQIVKLNLSLKGNSPVSGSGSTPSNKDFSGNTKDQHKHHKWKDEYTGGNRTVPHYRPTLVDKVKDFSPLSWAAKGTMFEDSVERIREKSRFKKAGGTSAQYEDQQRAAREFSKIHDHERQLRGMGFKKSEINSYRETDILGESKDTLGDRKKQARELLGKAFNDRQDNKVTLDTAEDIGSSEKITPDKIFKADLNKSEKESESNKATPLSNNEFSLSEEELENFTVQKNILKTLEDIRDCCGGGNLGKKGSEKAEKVDSLFDSVAQALDFTDDALDVGRHLRDLKGTLGKLLPIAAALGTAFAGAATAIGAFAIGKWLSEEFDKTESGKALTKALTDWGNNNQKQQISKERDRRNEGMSELESIKESNPELYATMQKEIKDSLAAISERKKEEAKNTFFGNMFGSSDEELGKNSPGEVTEVTQGILQKHKRSGEIEKRKLGGDIETNKQYIAGEEGQELFVTNDGKYSQIVGDYGPELLESETQGFVYPITGKSKDSVLNRQFLDVDKARPNAFVYPEEKSDKPEKADPVNDFNPEGGAGGLENSGFMGTGTQLGRRQYNMTSINPSNSSVANAMPSIPGANGPAGNAIDNIVSGSGDDALLQQIYKMEGTSDEKAQKHGYASGYDATLGYGKFGGGPDGKPLSSMTMAEVRQLQEQILDHPDNKHNSSAVGKPQVVGKTLFGRDENGYGTGGLYKELGLKEDDIFDQKLQDRITLHLANKRGLDKFKKGDISAEQFQERLAPEWQSIEKAGLTPELRQAMEATRNPQQSSPLGGQGTLGQPSIAYDSLKAGKGIPKLPDNVTIAGSAARPGGLDGVDPAVIEGVLGAAKNHKGRVEIISGNRGAGDLGNHSAKKAIDVQLYDEKGRKISNHAEYGGYQNPQAYEQYMTDAVAWGSQYEPAMEKDARYGGYFGQGGGDWMHLDRMGGKGMAKGSWKNGRTDGGPTTGGLNGKTWAQYREERFGKPKESTPAEPTKVSSSEIQMNPDWEEQLAADISGKGTSKGSSRGTIDDSNTLTSRMMDTPATVNKTLPLKNGAELIDNLAKVQKPVDPNNIDDMFADASMEERRNNLDYDTKKQQKNNKKTKAEPSKGEVRDFGGIKLEKMPPSDSKAEFDSSKTHIQPGAEALDKKIAESGKTKTEPSKGEVRDFGGIKLDKMPPSDSKAEPISDATKAAAEWKLPDSAKGESKEKIASATEDFNKKFAEHRANADKEWKSETEKVAAEKSKAKPSKDIGPSDAEFQQKVDTARQKIKEQRTGDKKSEPATGAVRDFGGVKLDKMPPPDTAKPLAPQPSSGNKIHNKSSEVSEQKRAANKPGPNVTVNHRGGAGGLVKGGRGSGGPPPALGGPSRNGESMWQQYVLSRYGLNSVSS